MRASLVIALITLGWILGTALVMLELKMKEPVVCIVKLQSGPIGTHNFKGVVK